jgi:hypothetical protein
MQYALSTPAGDPADDKQERWDRYFQLRYAERWHNADAEDRLEMLISALGSIKVNQMLTDHFFDSWEAAIREREGT